MNFLFFGDSITYGENDIEHSGWVNRFRKQLDNEFGLQHNVHNLGVCGDISAEVLARFDAECKPRYERFDKNCVIVFAVGINDAQTVEG